MVPTPVHKCHAIAFTSQARSVSPRPHSGFPCEAMQVFLAMTPEMAAAVEETKKLSVTSLSFPRYVRHVPLKDTKSLALDAVVKANGMHLPGMARTWTEWSVLKLWIPQSTAFEMVSAGNLERYLDANGWKLFAELDYTDLTATWEVVTKIGTK